MQDLDFLVDRITDDGLVIGRNGYVDVPVGTIFRVIAKTRVDGPTEALSTVDLGTVAQVKFRLTEVWHFRRSIDAIPRGHSAGLRLDGETLDVLRSALEEKRPREFVSLRVAPRTA